MGIFDKSDFTLKEKAERGLALPEILNAFEIMVLWSGEDIKMRDVLIKLMYSAIIDKKLKIQRQTYDTPIGLICLGSVLEIYLDDERIYVSWDSKGFETMFPYDSETRIALLNFIAKLKREGGWDLQAQIKRLDFLAWLNNENEPLPTACLIENWWKDLVPKTEISDTEVFKATTPINQKIAKSNAYDRRKASFDKWVQESSINVKALITEDIYKQLKVYDKNEWNISLSAFRRDFWPKYSIDNNLQKSPGAPRKI